MLFWAVSWSIPPLADAEVEFGGSVRTIAAGYRNYEQPLLFGEGNRWDGASQSIVRITAAGGLGPRLSGEVHVIQDVTFTTREGLTGSAGAAGAATPPWRYRAADGQWDWADDDDTRASLQLDRCNVTLAVGRVDVTLGRQAVNFAQAYFWNPLDVFLPFDPHTFDRDYKPGIDALRIDLQTGPFSGLTFVAAVGREIYLDQTSVFPETRLKPFHEEQWNGSAGVVRWFANLGGWDASLQAGKVHGGFLTGGGGSGELGPFGVRGEAAYYWPSEAQSAWLPAASDDAGFRRVKIVRDQFTAVAGIDRRFASSLYVNAEYFYNGGGDPDRLETGLLRVALGQTQNLGRQYLGTQVSYELHPLMTGGTGVIQSLSDGSTLITGSLVYSVADEAEASLGVIAGHGDRPRPAASGGLRLRSEFGTYPAMIYGEIKFYF